MGRVQRQFEACIRTRESLILLRYFYERDVPETPVRSERIAHIDAVIADLDGDLEWLESMANLEKAKEEEQ